MNGNVLGKQALNNRLKKEFEELITLVTKKEVGLIGDKQRTLVKTKNLRVDKQGNGKTSEGFYQVAIQDNVPPGIRSSVYASVLISPNLLTAAKLGSDPEPLRMKLRESGNSASMVKLVSL